MSEPAAEFDGPWKEALEDYFCPFLDLFFPQIEREVDWDREVEFHDKELLKIVPDAATGTGIVDKLAKVWTRQGVQECVFVHVEVQTQNDPDLPRRLYQYNHRLEDKYGQMPVSLAVLGDIAQVERPAEFVAGRWGCRVQFTYPVARVADFRDREAVLEASTNPFAPFVLAHLKTVQTDRDPAERLAWKLRVVKGLYDRGLDAVEIRRMFRLVDWMMTLPPVLATVFSQDLDAFEKEKEMPVITQTEQIWLDRAAAAGRREARLEFLRLMLKFRFKQAGLDLMPRIEAITDPAALDRLRDVIETVPDVETFVALLPPQQA